ncbi:MAG: S41 family peptidase [Prevotella sp.]|jgi:hypothetical protein|nr:S41 family peptidase [Prevotella sp.]
MNTITKCLNLKSLFLSKMNIILFIDKINFKRYLSIILFMSVGCSFIYSQSKYLIKDKEGFDFVLNVSVDENTINGFTRENTLLDYASKLSYQLIKAASSLKHPEIIRFTGILTNGHFKGTYDYLFSSYKIEGDITSDSISYSLFNKDNELYKSFKGRRADNYVKKDYVKLAAEIIKITEENIFDPKIIQSKKWADYRKKMLDTASKTSDDLEFQTGFFILARKIGFSHYYIFKNVYSADRKWEKPSLREIGQNSVVLRITNFYEKGENIKPLLDTIRQKAYRNLIIDLRDNVGGGAESTSLIANFLTDKEFISGFFPNRNWYENYDRLPNKNDIDKFYPMDAERDTVQASQKYGFYIRTKRNENNFKGHAYILVNKKTGSAAEGLVIGVKEYNLARVIGEKTAGGLLNAKQFKIDEDIMLVVPVNDFVSYNGYRVDQKGIKPDIEIKKGKDIEQQLLEIIK